MSEPLLTMRNLRVAFPDGLAVRGVDLDVGAGEVVALCGESGSGKSVTCLAALGLNGSRAVVEADTLRVCDVDVLSADASTLRRLRGGLAGMVFQDAGSALNPFLRIDVQLTEGLRLHRRLGREEARRRASELLGLCGLASPDAVMRAYPHQLSGGMKQRVLIAATLVLEPRLVLADEPTTALDVTTQAQVLRVLRDRLAATGAGCVLVTHDFGVAAAIADRMVVMYAGSVVEDGPVDVVLNRPMHPYTRALAACLPRFDDAEPPRALAGAPPRPGEVTGCAFAPRCADVEPRCRAEAPGVVDLGRGHRIACPVSAGATP